MAKKQKNNGEPTTQELIEAYAQLSRKELALHKKAFAKVAPALPPKGDGRAKIEGEQIVLRIDISDLPVIVEAGPSGDFMKVTNTKKFAKELVNAINEEEEDGTTAFHRVIDDASEAAFENGAEGVKELEGDEGDYGRDD